MSTVEEQNQQQPQAPNLQRDSELALSIKSLEEEELQLSELSEIEKSYLVQVVSHFKRIIAPLGRSYDADALTLRATVTQTGELSLKDGNTIITSVPLEKLQSQVLIRVLADIIPEVKSILVEKRQAMNAGIGTLEKVEKELRKVAAAVPDPDQQVSQRGGNLTSREPILTSKLSSGK